MRPGTHHSVPLYQCRSPAPQFCCGNSLCACVCMCCFFFFLFFSQTVFADPPRKQQTGESEVTRNASFYPHVPQNYNNRSFNRPLAPPCWIGFNNFLPNAGRSGVDGLFVSVNMDLNGGVLLLTTVRV